MMAKKGTIDCSGVLQQWLCWLTGLEIIIIFSLHLCDTPIGFFSWFFPIFFKFFPSCIVCYIVICTLLLLFLNAEQKKKTKLFRLVGNCSHIQDLIIFCQTMFWPITSWGFDETLRGANQLSEHHFIPTGFHCVLSSLSGNCSVSNVSCLS